MTGLARKLRTCSRLSGVELRLLSFCLAVAWLVRAGLWILPFRLVVRAAGAPGPRNRRRPGLAAARIAWAVRLACRYVPRATCLVQALTGQAVLGWYGHASRVRIGVALQSREFEAHAWLESQGQVLLGDSQELERYRPIAELCGRSA